MCTLCLAVLASLAPAAPILEKFAEFKAAFNRTYASPAEEQERLRNFARHVAAAERLAAADGGSARYGHFSPLADMSDAEFDQLNGFLLAPDDGIGSVSASYYYYYASYYSYYHPDSLDWRDYGAVTSVKQQGRCGSCWAFAATANIEAANFFSNGKLVSLSEQELVSCDTNHICRH